MKVVVLASGSKGNVTYVENNDTRILIDIGKSCSYVEKKLKELGVDPHTINAILITHTHSDHIDGIKTFYDRYKPVIYLMPRMISTINQYLRDYQYEYFMPLTKINDFEIDIIKTSHDAPDSVGFMLNNDLVYITDTGYLNRRYIPKIANKKMYIMESNHDIEMLYNGKYPYYLKQRIASDTGHLSNIDSSNYLKELIGENTRHVILAHLSENNNTKEKALETFLGIIENTDNFNVIIAEQEEITEVIEVWLKLYVLVKSKKNT